MAPDAEKEGGRVGGRKGEREREGRRIEGRTDWVTPGATRRYCVVLSSAK